MSAEERIPLASAEKGMHVFLDRQRDAATSCPPPSCLVPGPCAWDVFSNCPVNGKSTLTTPSLSVASPTLSERLSYFAQVHGQMRSSGEGAQSCTLPPLWTFHKGLARSCLTVAPAETVLLYGRADGAGEKK